MALVSLFDLLLFVVHLPRLENDGSRRARIFILCCPARRKIPQSQEMQKKKDGVLRELRGGAEATGRGLPHTASVGVRRGLRSMGARGWGALLSCLFEEAKDDGGWASQLGREAGRSGRSGVKPPAGAAISEKQIILPMVCPFLTQGTETLHFTASAYRRKPRVGGPSAFRQDPPPPWTPGPQLDREYLVLPRVGLGLGGGSQSGSGVLGWKKGRPSCPHLLSAKHPKSAQERGRAKFTETAPASCTHTSST